MGTSLFEQFEREQRQQAKPKSLYDQFLEEQPRPQRTAPAADVSAFRRPGSDRSGDLGSVLRDPKGTARSAFEFGAVGPLVAAQAIPGMEAFQAAAGSIGSKFTDDPLSYRESLDALRSQTEGIPEPLKMAAQFPAALRMLPQRAFSTIPKAMATSGGVGAAHGLAQADPDAGVGKRVADAALQGGTAAGLAGLLGGGVRLVEKGNKLRTLRNRIKAADDFDESAVARDKEITAATKENYTRSRAEAEAAGGTSPGVQRQLERPLTKRYADEIREEGENLSDAELLMAVDRRMTEARKGHAKSLKRDYSDSRASEIRKIKREQTAVRDAIASASEKPPITLDIAEEVTEVSPRVVNPGREARTGPIMEGTAGRARGDQSQVSVDPRGRVTTVSPRDVQGPAGPAFQLGAQAEKVTPGIRIETPAMRVQTAPAEHVGPVSPSYPRAVSEKARMEGEREAASEAAGMASRVARGLRTKPEQAHLRSPAAYLDRIRRGEMPENEVEAALGAFLSGAKRDVGMDFSPWLAGGGAGLGSLFGGPAGGVAGSVVLPTTQAALRSGIRVNRLMPFVEALDRAAGRMSRRPANLDNLLRILSATTNASPIVGR